MDVTVVIGTSNNGKPTVIYRNFEYVKSTTINPEQRHVYTDRSNYRPIAISCVTYKLLETIIGNQIRNQRINNNLLNNA